MSAAGESLGLRPRPQPDPVVVALVTAAAQQLWPRPVLAPTDDARRRQAWRFSGRWWSRPLPVRRDRPWVD